MSLMLFLAATVPLDTVKNPHIRTLTVNEALEMGWKDIPPWFLEPGFDRNRPILFQREPPAVYDHATGSMNDGNFDDDFEIYALDPEDDPSGASKPYRVAIECTMTYGRAKRILEYIQSQLAKTDEIELWSLWLSEEKQKLCRYEINIDELTPYELMKIDKLPGNRTRPKLYCFRIHK